MDDIIETVGKNLLGVIGDAIKAGKSRKEAEAEGARAVERGDIVSDDLYERFENYIDETKKFEDEG